MRLKSANENDSKEMKEFVDWLLNVGEGKLGAENNGEVEIEFPSDVLINFEGDSLEAMISAIYPTIEKDMEKPGYFENKAILVPTNEEVDMINDHLFKKLKRPEKLI